jgi:hypothetical protein
MVHMRKSALLEVTLTNGAKIRFRCKEFSFTPGQQTNWTNVSWRKRLIHLPPDQIAAVVRIR